MCATAKTCVLQPRMQLAWYLPYRSLPITLHTFSCRDAGLQAEESLHCGRGTDGRHRQELPQGHLRPAVWGGRAALRSGRGRTGKDTGRGLGWGRTRSCWESVFVVWGRLVKENVATRVADVCGTDLTWQRHL